MHACMHALRDNVVYSFEIESDKATRVLDFIRFSLLHKDSTMEPPLLNVDLALSRIEIESDSQFLSDSISCTSFRPIFLLPRAGCTTYLPLHIGRRRSRDESDEADFFYIRF